MLPACQRDWHSGGSIMIAALAAAAGFRPGPGADFRGPRGWAAPAAVGTSGWPPGPPAQKPRNRLPLGKPEPRSRLDPLAAPAAFNHRTRDWRNAVTGRLP
jgi:hypothetical protein